MPKLKNVYGFAPIVVILIIVLVTIGAYFLGTQKNIFQTPQGTPSPTQTPDPTANWKTYTSVNKDFSFKYPDDWEGPMRLSGTDKQGQASFQGDEGSITVYWGGGFGGGPCPGEKWIVEISGGPLGFCVTKNQATEEFSVANDGPAPTGFPGVMISGEVAAPVTQNEALIKQILSTFKFTPKPTVKTTPSPEVLPKRKLSYVLPSGWQTTNTIENLFTIGYDPELWEAACPEYFGKSCKLILKTDRSYQFWTFQISTVNYSGGSRRAVLQDRYGTVHDEFEEVELDGIKGVGTIFRQPMEAGGNKYVAGFPVGNKMIIFTSSVLNTYSGKDSGFDLNYIYKVLATLQIE